MAVVNYLLAGKQKNMLGNWYVLSMISLIFMGMQRFLYKVSSQRGCNTAWTTFTFMGTVTVLSVIFLFVTPEPISGIPFLLFVSLVNSVSFTVATMTHMEALNYLPSSIAYPIIRLNAAVVVLFSIIFFSDRPSGYQVIGIFIAIMVVMLLARESNDQNTPPRDIRKGFSLVAICVVCGAMASVSSKFAAMHSNKMAFIALSYLMGTLFSFAFRKRLETGPAGTGHGDAVIIGIIHGTVELCWLLCLSIRACHRSAFHYYFHNGPAFCYSCHTLYGHLFGKADTFSGYPGSSDHCFGHFSQVREFVMIMDGTPLTAWGVQQHDVYYPTVGYPSFFQPLTPPPRTVML